MKRFRRWPFNWFAALSTLLCLGLSLAAARSFWVAYYVDKHTWDSARNSLCYIEVYSEQGSLNIECRNSPYMIPDTHATIDRMRKSGQLKWHFSAQANSAQSRLWNRLWQTHFWWKSGALAAGPWANFELTVPYGPLLLLSGIAPAIWLGRFRRIHTFGICDSCGYDLRATPDRCPECGTIPQATK